LRLFVFPSLYVAVQGVLSLLASGRNTGLVIDNGEDKSHCVPVYESHVISHAVMKQEYAGKSLTTYMVKCFVKEDFILKQEKKLNLYPKSKRIIAMLPWTFITKLKLHPHSSSIERYVKLPNSQTIVIEKERFRCPEALFNPYFSGSTATGLTETAKIAIKKCDLDIQTNLFENIVFAGGSSMFLGISERFQKELSTYFPQTSKIKISTPPNRNVSAWIGGSILASLDSFNEMWISMENYEEIGASVVHSMCFYSEKRWNVIVWRGFFG
jgi:actin-related protein